MYNKEYIIIFFVLYLVMGALPFTENIIFGNNENISFKSLNKIERFGTQKRSSSSDNDISSITKLNKKDFNKNITYRIYQILNKKLPKFNKSIEITINKFINDTKNNKEITNRIINGKYFADDKLADFKKDLYLKLSKAKMEKLYYPITGYINFLNKKIFPILFRSFLVKDKFKLTIEDKFLIKIIVKSIINTDISFKVSEFIFMYTILREGEHKTLNKDLIKAMQKQDPDYLKKTSPFYNINFISKYFNFKYLNGMRIDTFLVYLTFFYSKFIKQIIMFRKLSFIRNNFELKRQYRTFLIKTSQFVNEINMISLSLFKKNSPKVN